MGRQAIGQSADYPKLRNMLVAVVSAGLVLTGLRVLIPRNLGASPKKEAVPVSPLAASSPPVVRTYRPGVKPGGVLAASVKRMDLSSAPMADMNDRGDYLFLVSPAGVDYREYIHIFNGKSYSSGHVPAMERWGLTPNGSIVKRNDMLSPFLSGRANYGNVGWAYNEFRFYRRFTDDGSTIYVNNETRKKVLTSRLMQDKAGSPSKVYYTSNGPLSILDIDEKGRIWVKEAFDTKTDSKSRLLKFTGFEFESIPFPKGYETIDRVCATGDVIAGTFGSSNSGEPLRTYVHSKTGWKELPLPPNSAFSFVQKVFNNGAILGFVTDEGRSNMRQVLWYEDSVAILNDAPAWPKLGQFSLITRASRRGDVYVRSVMNTESGASENYLLHIGLSDGR